MTYADLFFITCVIGMIVLGEVVPQLKYISPISDGSVLRCNGPRVGDPRVTWNTDCWIDERVPAKMAAVTGNPNFGVTPADDFCWTTPHCSKNYKGDAPQPLKWVDVFR